MSYSNGKITAPVSINDLQRCFGVTIEATVNGTKVRRLSSDLGLIVKGRVGDTVTGADGTVWTLVSRRQVNPWAKYKAFPAANTANNVPRRLSAAQLSAESYGTKMLYDAYGNDGNGSIESMLNDPAYGLDFGALVYVRPFQASHWARLTDFVSPEDPANVGYNHNAKPADFTVMVNSTDTYRMQPLIPDGQRTMTIRSGETKMFEFPLDKRWLGHYASPQSTDVITKSADELTVLDLFLGSTYGTPLMNNGGNARRGVKLFRWNEGQGKWSYVGEKYDTEVNLAPPRSARGAVIDLSASNSAERIGTGNYFWGTIEGRFVIVEMYTIMGSGGTAESYPIPGFCYEIDITRVTDTFGILNRTNAPWIFGLEQTSDPLLILTASRDSTSRRWQFSTEFTELLLVIYAPGGGTPLKSWDLTAWSNGGFVNDSEKVVDQDGIYMFTLDPSVLGGNPSGCIAEVRGKYKGESNYSTYSIQLN